MLISTLGQETRSVKHSWCHLSLYKVNKSSGTYWNVYCCARGELTVSKISHSCVKTHFVCWLKTLLKRQEETTI